MVSELDLTVDESSNDTITPAALVVVINTEHGCANESDQSPFCVFNYYYNKDETRSLAVAISLAFVVIFALAVNFLGLFAVIFAHKVPIITKILISHLSFCCFILAFLTMPLAIVVEMFDGNWAFGSDLCRAYETVNVVLPPVVLYGLAVVVVDERLALNKLMTHGKPQNAWDALKRCATVWLAAVIAAVSAILGWRTWHPLQTDDKCSFKDDNGFVLFRTIAMFLVPGCILLIFIYSFNIKRVVEARTIRNKYHDAKIIDVEVCSGLHMKVHDSEQDDDNNKNSNTTPEKSFKYVDDEFLGADDRVKKQKLLWSKLKVETNVTQAIRMASIISLSCFSPLYISVVADSFCSCIPSLVIRISLWLGYFTLIIVPSSYLIMVPKIRRASLRLLPCCRTCLSICIEKADEINKKKNERAAEECQQNRAKSIANSDVNLSTPFRLLRLLRGQLSTSSRSEPDVANNGETSPSLSAGENHNCVKTSQINIQSGVGGNLRSTKNNNCNNNIISIELTLDDLVVKKDVILKRNKKMKQQVKKLPMTNNKEIIMMNINRFSIKSSQSIESSLSTISTPSSTLSS